VIITDTQGQRLKDVVGPFDEGIDLLLICEAEGGKCQLTFSFFFF